MTLNASKVVFIFVVASALGAVAIFIGSFKYYENALELDMTDVDPKGFPVVVIRRESAELVRLDSEGKADLRTAEDSLLIPASQEELVKARLRIWFDRNWGKGVPYVTVTPIDENRQLIHLDVSIDGFYESRYEVNGREVKPLMFKRAGPGFIFLPMGLTAMGVIVFATLSLVARLILVRLRWIQWT